MALTPEESGMMATIVERLNNVKEDTDQIIKHQKYQNGKLAEVTIAVNKAQEIARSAEVLAKISDHKACINQRWTWGLAIAVIGAFATIASQTF